MEGRDDFVLTSTVEKAAPAKASGRIKAPRWLALLLRGVIGTPALVVVVTIVVVAAAAGVVVICAGIVLLVVVGAAAAVLVFVPYVLCVKTGLLRWPDD